MQQDVAWFTEAPVYQLRDAITVGHGINDRTGRRCVLFAFEVHGEPVAYGITPDRADQMADLLHTWAAEVRSLTDQENA